MSIIDDYESRQKQIKQKELDIKKERIDKAKKLSTPFVKLANKTEYKTKPKKINPKNFGGSIKW